MKNTTGYSLNAFLDFERPVDIFRNLLIGSEGTLAFIAEAVLNTVPDLPVKFTGLLLFPDLHAACAAIVPLRDAGAAALELHGPRLPALGGGPAGHSAIDQGPARGRGRRCWRSSRAANVSERAATGSAGAPEACAGLTLLEPAQVHPRLRASRRRCGRSAQGTFPSVGAVRARGTTVIIEDVAFPIEHLADAAVDLTSSFAKHGYDKPSSSATPRTATCTSSSPSRSTTRPRWISTHASWTMWWTWWSKRYDGALKAEHGTGRNMAPFVETEWGAEAYRIMKRLKELADPENLLNPGVIINPDPKAHLQRAQAHAGGRGGSGQVHRVRLLRSRSVPAAT